MSFLMLLNMDPEFYLQDVLRCHLCETAAPHLHCDICHKYVCKSCEGKHILDKSKEHRVVPFELRGCITNCRKHLSETCERYCEHCNIPICPRCASSKEHSGHALVDIVNKLDSQKKVLQRDLQDLEKNIYSKYLEIESDISFQSANFIENSKKVTIAIDTQEKYLYREIDKIVIKLKNSMATMEAEHRAMLNKQKYDIKCAVSEITSCIRDLKELLDSNDVARLSEYKSKNAEFRNLPPKLIVSLPMFTPQMVNTEHIHRQFGYLSELSIKMEENGYTLDSPPCRPLINEPWVITCINTKCKWLRSLSFLSDNELWTCSFNDKMMRLFQLDGQLVRSVQSKSRNYVYDITLTKTGDLIYTDKNDRTINIVTNTSIRTVIKLRGWRPRYVCNTSSDDILVVMCSDDNKQTKVVRYSDFTEKQSIQYNDTGQPLFSFNGIKYIIENKNQDICVSDCQSNSVVVVNQNGIFRFAYTGYPSAAKKPFIPVGIATDSQSWILTADWNNQCIHIIDHDGQFLGFIDNCKLQCPWGLCVDTNDDLFVAELYTGIVKKIRYNM